jgi:hypothetical protein
MTSISEPATAVADGSPGLVTAAATALRREQTSYSHGEHRPLAAFLGLMGFYGAGVGTLALSRRAAGGQVPAGPEARDLILTAVATYRAARLVSKDAVTSPVGAVHPFS